MVIALREAEARMKALGVGADDFLTKLADERELRVR